MMINVINFNDGICYTSLCVFVTNHTLNSSVDLKKTRDIKSFTSAVDIKQQCTVKSNI